MQHYWWLLLLLLLMQWLRIKRCRWWWWWWWLLLILVQWLKPRVRRLVKPELQFQLQLVLLSLPLGRYPLLAPFALQVGAV